MKKIQMIIKVIVSILVAIAKVLPRKKEDSPRP